MFGIGLGLFLLFCLFGLFVGCGSFRLRFVFLLCNLLALMCWLGCCVGCGGLGYVVHACSR